MAACGGSIIASKANLWLNCAMKTRTRLIAALLFFVGSAAILLLYMRENRTLTEYKVRVSATPNFSYHYDSMKIGVIQHVDREYTYDYIPAELENGLLFQGIHRPVEGTGIKIELDQPATIYFFFQNTWDGGYTEISQLLRDGKNAVMRLNMTSTMEITD